MARRPHRPARDLHPFGPAEPLPPEEVRRLAAADRSALWKPFTQMADYERDEPLIVREARGNWLRDVQGRVYLDGVSSLWVNVHGHGRESIVRAIAEQAATLDHSTMLGPSNVPAIELAQRLVAAAPNSPGSSPLTRVFYSDSGSTAVEIAVKMAFQYWAQHEHEAGRRRDVFISMSNAYHGDTLGSVSVGGIGLFHAMYRPLLFRVQRAPAPDAYHRAFGEDAAAHEQECLDALEQVFEAEDGCVAALVMEPLVQGAAGMLTHSADYLGRAAAIARKHGALLILDEVATGFGRTGTMFACEQAGVTPDLLCVAKGLSGGVLPLAATLATEQVYGGFLGEHTDYRSFFHGHSYTGNPIACAAAIASLDLFETEDTLGNVRARAEQLSRSLETIADHPHVGDIRRVGLMTGIELVRDRATGEGFAPEHRVAHRVILRAREQGVLIRPLGPVVVLMPPLSITEDELDLLTGVVFDAIDVVTAELA